MNIRPHLIRHSSFIIRHSSFLLLLLALCACTKTKETLVITVGGLGFSQMHDLREAVTAQCPDAKVVSAGAWDAYKTDLKKIATEKPRKHIILIGHSFGCRAIDDAAAQLPQPVDLAVFIEPAWDDFSLSTSIRRNLWFKRSNFDLVREAKIVGASSPRTINGGHNDIPHSPELINEVVAAIKRVQAEGPHAEPRRLASAGETPNAKSRSQKPVARSQENGETPTPAVEPPAKARPPVRIIAPPSNAGILPAASAPPPGIW